MEMVTGIFLSLSELDSFGIFLVLGICVLMLKGRWWKHG